MKAGGVRMVRKRQTRLAQEKWWRIVDTLVMMKIIIILYIKILSCNMLLKLELKINLKMN